MWAAWFGYGAARDQQTRMSKLGKLGKLKRNQGMRKRKLGTLKENRTWYGTPKRAAFACAFMEMVRNHSSSSIAVMIVSTSSESARLQCGRLKQHETGQRRLGNPDAIKSRGIPY
jgi:hypothetical protein